mmetsp:Transcript_127336/g.291171  ORF Transcript_127336/g.291171 Transcript_127336/m.291171 type:complete len:211 (+) Transcript_127336:28-660(+)
MSASSHSDHTTTVSNALEFLRVVGKLKEVKRTGWVRSGVKGAESVADHMFRMAMISFLVGPKEGLDKDKCIKMALVHDIGEAVIGDLVVVGEKDKQDKITKEEKQKLERKAVQEMCAKIPGVGEEILALWEEFEAAETPEARHVQDCDKFEMVLQASEYEENQGMQLPDFYRTTAGIFRTPFVSAMDAEVRKRRSERIQDEPEAKKSKME